MIRLTAANLLVILFLPIYNIYNYVANNKSSTTRQIKIEVKTVSLMIAFN
jgi:hypothetical protein